MRARSPGTQKTIVWLLTAEALAMATVAAIFISTTAGPQRRIATETSDDSSSYVNNPRPRPTKIDTADYVERLAVQMNAYGADQNAVSASLYYKVQEQIMHDFRGALADEKYAEDLSTVIDELEAKGYHIRAMHIPPNEAEATSLLCDQENVLLSRIRMEQELLSLNPNKEMLRSIVETELNDLSKTLRATRFDLDAICRHHDGKTIRFRDSLRAEFLSLVRSFTPDEDLSESAKKFDAIIGIGSPLAHGAVGSTEGQTVTPAHCTSIYKNEVVELSKRIGSKVFAEVLNCGCSGDDLRMLQNRHSAIVDNQIKEFKRAAGKKPVTYIAETNNVTFTSCYAITKINGGRALETAGSATKKRAESRAAPNASVK